MSTCPKCTASIAPDARFCTECGAEIPPSIPFAEPDSGVPNGDQAHTALAAANLCKLRGDWQAAIDKCILVLALDEDNAAAHSLLGDIYRDQGHLSEAMHWYKLALDLDPGSAADKNKLDQLLAQKYPDRSSRSDRKAEMLGSVKRVLAEAGLAIGVLLLITTVWPILSRPKPGEGETPKQQEYPQRVNLPATIPEHSSEPAQPSAKPVEPHMSRAEATLLQTLNASPMIIRRNLRVKDVAIDPRDRSAVITCACFLSGKEADAQTLARSGLMVLREACFKDSGLERMTVRVSCDASGDNWADVRFVADAERNDVLSINPETAEPSQLTGVLRNPWFAPGVK